MGGFQARGWQTVWAASVRWKVMGASSAENSQYSRESLYNGVFIFSFYLDFFPLFYLILVERKTAGLL